MSLYLCSNCGALHKEASECTLGRIDISKDNEIRQLELTIFLLRKEINELKAKYQSPGVKYKKGGK